MKASPPTPPTRKRKGAKAFYYSSSGRKISNDQMRRLMDIVGSFNKVTVDIHNGASSKDEVIAAAIRLEALGAQVGAIAQEIQSSPLGGEADAA